MWPLYLFVRAVSIPLQRLCKNRMSIAHIVAILNACYNTLEAQYVKLLNNVAVCKVCGRTVSLQTVVGLMTWLMDAHPTNPISIPGWSKKVLVPRRCPDRLYWPPNLLFMAYHILLPRDKSAEE
jgi:hypothetical protein